MEMEVIHLKMDQTNGIIYNDKKKTEVIKGHVIIQKI